MQNCKFIHLHSCKVTTLQSLYLELQSYNFTTEVFVVPINALNSSFFYDWLTVYQEFSDPLPMVGDVVNHRVTVSTGDIETHIPSLKHGGSFSSQIDIRISGSRLTVSGNPSRWNRPDNLFGFSSLDDCFAVYNEILTGLGLPPFTKCTRIMKTTNKDGKVHTFSDGAVIKELHITTNKCVGKGNEQEYIMRGLGTQHYRNMIPHVKPNGMTCEWLGQSGERSTLIYASCYNKGNQLVTKTLPSLKKELGEEHPDYKYALSVANYCIEQGVVRFEQKLIHRILQRMGCRYWGLENISALQSLQDEFLSIDSRLKVNAMTLESISEQLIAEGICNGVRAANTTAMYAIQWMTGQQFDFEKSSVKTHRGRLRKIGIDIKRPCDVSAFSPVRVKEIREIHVSDLSMPAFYRAPTVNRLRLVA